VTKQLNDSAILVLKFFLVFIFISFFNHFYFVFSAPIALVFILFFYVIIFVFILFSFFPSSFFQQKNPFFAVAAVSARYCPSRDS